MGNITQNKPATASNSFAPFLPARAVDGVTSPANRWVSAQVPAWLAVDLQNIFWVNQWTANLMGSVGWTPGYNMKNFILQGSNDNVNWFDMDNISNNSANQINRTIAPRLARFLRVYVSNGLTVNDKVASIVDFQAFEPATAPFLASLIPSTGSFTTAFGSRSFNYSLSVASTVNTMTFTPTAAQANLEIKVNGTVVASGSPSQQVAIAAGTTTVSITVKSSDGSMLTTYTVNVTKAGNTNLYLDHVVFNYSGRGKLPGTQTVAMIDTQTAYQVNVETGYSAVTVTPYARDTSVAIKVDNLNVPSGGTSASIALPTTGDTSVTIVVSSPDGATSRTYSFNLWKVSI